MFLKQYRKLIVEKKGFIIFSILVAIAIRLCYYMGNWTNSSSNSGLNFLWNKIEHLFSGKEISILAAMICVTGIAFLASHINTKHILIRKKTYLPIAFTFFAFSFNVHFMDMNVHYLSVIAILLVITSLFSSYNNNYKQAGAFEASFILGLGSFFDTSLLLYLPLIWITLPLMRSFKLKGILASLLAVILLYAPVYSYFLLTDQITSFYQPFVNLVSEIDIQQAFLSFNLINWVHLTLVASLALVIFIDTYSNSFKDKIRTRAYTSLLDVFLIYSLCILFLTASYTITGEYIALAVSVLLLSHFFSVAESKWKIWLFVLYLILYIVLCVLNFTG